MPTVRCRVGPSTYHTRSFILYVFFIVFTISIFFGHPLFHSTSIFITALTAPAAVLFSLNNHIECVRNSRACTGRKHFVCLYYNLSPRAPSEPKKSANIFFTRPYMCSVYQSISLYFLYLANTPPRYGDGYNSRTNRQCQSILSDEPNRRKKITDSTETPLRKPNRCPQIVIIRTNKIIG